LDAMLALLFRHDPVWCRDGGTPAQTNAAGDRASHAREHLPLRHVPTDPACGGNGREAFEGGTEMNPFEPERYELHAGPAYTFELHRRDLFKVLGGGVVVLSMVSDAG